MQGIPIEPINNLVVFSAFLVDVEVRVRDGKVFYPIVRDDPDVGVTHEGLSYELNAVILQIKKSTFVQTFGERSKAHQCDIS